MSQHSPKQMYYVNRITLPVTSSRIIKMPLFVEGTISNLVVEIWSCINGMCEYEIIFCNIDQAWAGIMIIYYYNVFTHE